MLTRSSTTESSPLQRPNSNAKAALNTPQQRSGPAESGKLSVIGINLKIVGQGLTIISQGILQIDGEVEGDVAGSEIVIGERGQVRGTLRAEQVIIRGKVSGAIRSMTVTLVSSARVEGDIHHLSLVIERGAEFDGRCLRPSDASELKLDLDPYGQAGNESQGRT
jgi:cytoskeletal protein CcmA (bactofilin family)